MSDWWDFNRDGSFDWKDPVLGVTGAIIEPFFALGAAINAGTGGTSPTYNVWTAAQDSSGTTYSDVTQALSGYQGPGPGTGTWGIPVLNTATTRLPGDLVKAVTGLDIKTVLVAAGLLGAAVLLKK